MTIELTRYMGVRIEHIFETHNHADHVSGHGRLAAATGAAIHIHRLAEPDHDHESFDGGAEWELGSLVVRALHTPGPGAGSAIRASADRHQPSSFTSLARSRSQSARPSGRYFSSPSWRSLALDASQSSIAVPSSVLSLRSTGPPSRRR